MATQLIAPTTTSQTAEFSLANGTSAQIVVAPSLSHGEHVTLQCKAEVGGSYVPVDNSNSLRPGRQAILLTGPGDFQVTKPTTENAIGVFQVDAPLP